MNILGSLTANGTGNRNKYSFEEVLLMLTLKGQGFDRKQIAEVVNHPASSITYKLGKIKELAEQKNCTTEEELLTAVYESFGKKFISIEDFKQTVEDYQNEDQEATA